MARPEKNTVDYIPLDCQFSDSMQAVEALYGNDGFVVWVKLLQKLGRTENYIIDVRDDLHWSLFYPIFRISEQRLLDILNLLASLNCINKGLWERRIIYSTNFIKRISRVYKKRTYELKNINTILEEMGVFDTENPVSDTENPVSDTEYVQSKVKESKVKESKGNIISLSQEIKKEEREILKKYLLTKKKNVTDADAYIRKLIDNGDVVNILEKAKNWEEKKKKKAEVFNEVTESEMTEEETREAIKAAREKINKILKRSK